jgi:hypothetical protein
MFMRVNLKQQHHTIAESVRLVTSTEGSPWADLHGGTFMLTQDQLCSPACVLEPGLYEAELPDGANVQLDLFAVRQHEGYISGTFSTVNRTGQVLLQRSRLLENAPDNRITGRA